MLVVYPLDWNLASDTINGEKSQCFTKIVLSLNAIFTNNLWRLTAFEHSPFAARNWIYDRLIPVDYELIRNLEFCNVVVNSILKCTFYVLVIFQKVFIFFGFIWFHFFLRNPLFNIECVHYFVMSIVPHFLLQQCAVFEQHYPFGPGYDSLCINNPTNNS